MNNPFDLNRAADYSDSQIIDYWVDYSDDGLISLIEPKSQTPIHVLGGKGSGKTHLMRYCSFPVQKLRYENDVLSGLQSDGYIGIFSRANTIDTGRFQGKGQGDDKWGTLFNYYFEIRMCEQVLSTLVELEECMPDLSMSFDSVAQNSNVLFDDEAGLIFDSILSFYEGIVSLRKGIDIAVNNCAFTRSLDVRILVTPGNLLFGVPELICKHIEELSGVQLLYLIDEIENFSIDKQKFLNTIIRHRRGPCSFRLGARLYGIRTQKNYGSDEENKDGSEFKCIYLDKAMRSDEGTDGYVKFAKRLCAKRLIDAGFIDKNNDEVTVIKNLDGYFESLASDRYYKNISWNIVRSSGDGERKYFKRLRKQLKNQGRNSGLGVDNEKDIDFIIDKLSYPTYPLMEKINIFIFYQEWYRGSELKEAAKEISKGCSAFVEKDADSERHKHVYGHFSIDLLAQLYRDYSQQTTAMYAGLNSFIKMSAGVPRNFLIILNNVYKWACFNGEKPFTDVPISISTQREAILESSTFYFEEDARPGADVPHIKDAVARLAEYLREIRFASKPVEPSPLSFSVDKNTMSPEAVNTLHQAEKWSYVFEVGRGRPDANSQKVNLKYQLNPMLSPKWDLPIRRRGDVRLSVSIADAIFGNSDDEVYERAKKEYTDGLKAPLFGEKNKKKSDPVTRTIPFGFIEEDDI